MDIGKALTSGFSVLFENPKIFLPALVMAIISTCIQTVPMPIGNTLTGFVNWLVFFLPLTIIAALINLFLSGMVIRMVYDATRRRLSIGGAAKVVAGKYITLLVSSIVFGIAVMVGLVAFIAPGIFLMVQLLFFEYAILIDNEDIAGSLKKSWKMVKGKWWNVFALLLIIALISFGGGFVAGLLGVLSQIFYFMFYFFLVLFLSPWSAATLTFAYLQLRGKK